MDASVFAYAGILTLRTSTTGAERSARFARTARVTGEVPGGSCASSRVWLADPDVKISNQATAAFVKETRRTQAHGHERIVSADAPGRRARRSPVQLGQFPHRDVIWSRKRLVLLARLSAHCRAARTTRRSVRSSRVKCRVPLLPLESGDRRSWRRAAHVIIAFTVGPNRARGWTCGSHPAGTGYARGRIERVTDGKAGYQRCGAHLVGSSKPRYSRTEASQLHKVRRQNGTKKLPKHPL